MIFRKKTIITFITSLIIITFMNWTTVLAEEKLSIEVLPDKELFDISNMKPGDWAPRSTTIRNSGEVSFEYTTSVKPDSESLKLYNELLLEVRGADEELYNGRLSEFSGFSPRALSPNEKEELKYTVRFPEHLGNDFQGLDAKFTIYYTAEAEESNESGVEAVTGTIDSGEGSGGGVLPNTATNMFVFILIGILLISIGSIVSLLVLYNKKSKAL